MDNQKNIKVFNYCIGSRVKELRYHHNLSLYEFGLKAGLSNVAIFNLESGKTKRPHIRSLKKIIIAYGISFEWLYYGVGDMAPNNLAVAQNINQLNALQSEGCKNDTFSELTKKNKALQTELKRLRRLLNYFTLQQKMAIKITPNQKNIVDN